jgi:hypothetical protein
MRRLFAVAASAIALSACATAQPYGAAATPRAQGWDVQSVDARHYRVSYRGVGSPDLIHDYALLRAADLTIEQDGTWFRVDQEWVDAGDPGGVQPSVGAGFGGGRYGHHSYSGGGVGLGLSIHGATVTTVVLEVRIGEGPRPDERNAYDAADVAQTIRTRLNAG